MSALYTKLQFYASNVSKKATMKVIGSKSFHQEEETVTVVISLPWKKKDSA